jgi:hypothetical protein
MSFFKSIIIFFSLFIFSGCGQSAFNVFEGKTYSNAFNSVFDPTKIYEDSLQYTKKADIISEKNEIDAILNVTYLNPTSSQWDNPTSQSFIVGVFIVNDPNKQYLNHPDYILNINGSNNFIATPLDESLDIIDQKTVPLANKWAKYYFIQIDSEDFNVKENIEISLTNSKINRSTKVSFLSYN